MPGWWFVFVFSRVGVYLKSLAVGRQNWYHGDGLFTLLEWSGLWQIINDIWQTMAGAMVLFALVKHCDCDQTLKVYVWFVQIDSGAAVNWIIKARWFNFVDMCAWHLAFKRVFGFRVDDTFLWPSPLAAAAEVEPWRTGGYQHFLLKFN